MKYSFRWYYGANSLLKVFLVFFLDLKQLRSCFDCINIKILTQSQLSNINRSSVAHAERDFQTGTRDPLREMQVYLFYISNVLLSLRAVVRSSRLKWSFRPFLYVFHTAVEIILKQYSPIFRFAQDDNLLPARVIQLLTCCVQL